MKPLSKLCAETQSRYVNPYIRERDKQAGYGCISCDSPRIDDAGHFFAVGRKYMVNLIRFDERLIHGQCSSCNRFKGGGNRGPYEEGILKRYGQSYLDEMHRIKEKADQSTAKLTRDEIYSIRDEYRRKAKELS